MTRARRLSPARVARWAYLRRVGGLTFEAIVDMEDAASVDAQQSSQSALDGVEARRHAVPIGLRGDPEERTYLEAATAFSGTSAKYEAEPPNAAAIRMEVGRYRRVWELANAALASLLD